MSPFSRRLTRGRSCLHTNFHVSPPFPPGYFSLLMHARISVTRASPLCARGKIIISPGKLVVEFTASRNTRDPRGNLPFFLFLSFFFFIFSTRPLLILSCTRVSTIKRRRRGEERGEKRWREIISSRTRLCFRREISARECGFTRVLHIALTYERKHCPILS